MSKLTDLFNEVYYNQLRPDKPKPSNSSSSNKPPTKKSYVIKVKNKRKFHNEMRRSRKEGYRFLQRSGDRLHSSSYWFDFGVGNFRTFLVVFLLFIGFYMVVMVNNGDIHNINPFESGISILQEISNIGETAKDNMNSFVNSLNSWITTDKQVIDVTGGQMQGSTIWTTPVFTRVIKSISYSFAAIFNFLKFIFQVIVLIFRVLSGGI